MKLAVLRYQGDVREHLKYFKSAGADVSVILNPSELSGFDAIVLPGGESTTISKFIFSEGWDRAISDFVDNGGGVFATCAGLILLSKEIEGNTVKSLGILDVTVSRNAFGRQVESFEDRVRIEDGDFSVYTEGVFIRAPRILKVGENAKAVGFLGEEPVMVRQGKILAMSFHPELTDDTGVAEYFIKIVAGR